MPETKTTIGKLSFVTAIAAALSISACGRPAEQDWSQSSGRVCTDRAGKRVPEENCNRATGGGSNAFLWYYLGTMAAGRNNSGAAVPAYGQRVTGGSYSAPASYKPSPSVQRGGFGSSARASVGG